MYTDTVIIGFKLNYNAECYIGSEDGTTEDDMKCFIINLRPQSGITAQKNNKSDWWLVPC